MSQPSPLICPECERRPNDEGHAPHCPRVARDRQENEATIREHFDRDKLDPYDNAHGLDREDHAS